MTGEATPPPAPEFDPGLQSERTTLAWQRAALSIVIGSLVLTRLAAEWVGVAAVGAGLAGVLVALVVFVRSQRRHARLGRAGGPPHPMPGAALLAVLVAVALVFGGGALVFVVLTALG